MRRIRSWVETAALMTDDRDRAAPEVTEARDDRAVVGEAAIAVNLEKVAHQMLDVVQRLRPRGIAREAYSFDCAEALPWPARPPSLLEPSFV